MSGTIIFLIINVVGGISVLGGYLVCLYVFPDQREALWGGVQNRWQSVFTVSMLMATAGYLLFSYGILFKSSPEEFSSRLLNNSHVISVLCMAFLISAAIWMPATIAYLKTGNSIWWTISVTSLWITAISLIIVTFIVIAYPSAIPSSFFRGLTISGISYVTFHCLMLDAIIWVSRFDVPLRN